jgi:hypothetical protein
MSTLNDLAVMQKLVDMKYRQQQESFARLLAQESSLRTSLRQLDEHLTESRSSNDTPQKAIGADVVWQAWVGRKKHELNMKLAQVLAVKERHVAQVRLAYGKVLVTDDLHTQVSKDHKQKKAQSQLDRAITSMLFRSL